MITGSGASRLEPPDLPTAIALVSMMTPAASPAHACPSVRPGPRIGYMVGTICRRRSARFCRPRQPASASCRSWATKCRTQQRCAEKLTGTPDSQQLFGERGLRLLFRHTVTARNVGRVGSVRFERDEPLHLCPRRGGGVGHDGQVGRGNLGPGWMVVVGGWGGRLRAIDCGWGSVHGVRGDHGVGWDRVRLLVQ